MEQLSAADLPDLGTLPTRPMKLMDRVTLTTVETVYGSEPPTVDVEVCTPIHQPPSNQDLIALADETDLTYQGGRNGWVEEADISEEVVRFAREVLKRYGA